MRSRLTLLGLASALVVTGALIALALNDPADLVQFVDTGLWSPEAPGPSGVAYRSSTNTLIVVDSERNGFGYDGINLYEYSLTTGLVVNTGHLPLGGATDDATGVAIDNATNTLFVSSDSTSTVYVVHAGADGKFGTGDDGTAGQIVVGDDTEDPAFDPVSGHLFVLDGNASLIYDVNPVDIDGTFGNGNDTSTFFAIPGDGVVTTPFDWEGLAINPVTGNLIAGSKAPANAKVIYEFTTAGVYIEKHSAASITGLTQISGLGAQPATGPYPVTYWIADRGGSSGATTFDGALYRITFGPAPVIPPVAPVLTTVTPSPMPVNEGTQVSFDANFMDANLGDTHIFSLTGKPAGSAFNTATGVFTWTPTEAQGPGVYPMTVRVTDSSTLFDEQALSITVNEVNSPPVVTNPGSLLRGEGETVDITMFGTDPDLPVQTKTWSAAGLPPGLVINSSTGHITGTITAGATAGSPYTSKVRLTDNGAGALFDEETFSFSITDTNPHGPVLNAISNKTITRGASLTFKATATDADGDGLIFSLVSPPSGATISGSGNFSWTPSQAPGNYPITVKVTDNGAPARSDSKTFTVTVEAVVPGETNPFIDDDGHVFENAIEWLDAQGITSGCNPPLNDRFCPNEYVTRGQMAAFLVRALHYSDGGNVNYFTDDNGHVFENAINRLRTAGVTQGCNPPANDRYCPNAFVTRGQMAAFLVRAFGYTAGGNVNYFTDDNGSLFETAINRLRTAGVTLGCNPPVNDHYCPNDRVTRGQMAAFLKRALGE